MPPPYTSHQDAPTTVVANEHYEVHTAKSGTESETGAFADARPESALLDHGLAGKSDTAHGRRVTYDGSFIGTFRTATAGSGRPNSLVKMHLVNSYLHPDANTWSGNWFWGSFDLNKLHNGFEEAAKKCHPAYTSADGKGAVLLRYATKRGAARPSALGLADFKTAVTAKLTTLRDQTVGADTATALDENAIKIGGFDLATFHNAWVAAVAACAASSFEVRYSYATGKPDALVWSKEEVSPADASKIVDEEYIPDIMANSSADAVWLTKFPMPRGGRGKRKEPETPVKDKLASDPKVVKTG